MAHSTKPNISNSRIQTKAPESTVPRTDTDMRTQSHYARLQRKLAHTVKGSHNREKLKRKLAVEHAKIRNKRHEPCETGSPSALDGG